MGAETLRLGPHENGTALLIRSLRYSLPNDFERHGSYRPAAQGYALRALAWILEKGESIPDIGAARKELVENGLSRLRHLESIQDRVVGGGPAFGYVKEFDAFGDGSVNPAFTAYTFQSGTVLWGATHFVGYLADHPEHQPENYREFEEMVGRWIAYWESSYTEFEESGRRLGYFWYSDSRNDAAKAVHNTSALIAMAADRWRQVRPDDPVAQRMGARADACLRYYVSRLRPFGEDKKGLVWNYYDDGVDPKRRVVEDVSHALMSTHFIRQMTDQGLFDSRLSTKVRHQFVEVVWKGGGPATLPLRMDPKEALRLPVAKRRTYTRDSFLTYAALINVPAPSILTWELAASIFFSSYLSESVVNPKHGIVDEVRCLGLANLITDQRGSVVAWEASGHGSDQMKFVQYQDDDWEFVEGFEAGYSLNAIRAEVGASMTLRLDDDNLRGKKRVISVIWASLEDGQIMLEDRSTILLPATSSKDKELRWHRTSFAIPAAKPSAKLSFSNGVHIHRVVIRAD